MQKIRILLSYDLLTKIEVLGTLNKPPKERAQKEQSPRSSDQESEDTVRQAHGT